MHKQLNDIVKESVSYSEVLRKLNLRISGASVSKLKKMLIQQSINTSHFLGKASRKGKIGTNGGFKPIPIEEVLVNGRFCNSNHLKNRLIKLGLKEAKCEKCRLIEWQGKPIGLQLDHINGKHDDNRIENLKILCPNCHYQTETWGNKK